MYNPILVLELLVVVFIEVIAAFAGVVGQIVVVETDVRAENAVVVATYQIGRVSDRHG